MVVDSARPAVSLSSASMQPAAPGRDLRPVIDAKTIRSILYLGLKGTVALEGASADSDLARAPSAGRGVDTYA